MMKPNNGSFARFSASCLWAVALLVSLCFLFETLEARAADAKVIKVLPQYLDQTGRHALSASLYERDAYQFYLRKHPKERAGIRLAVQWKADQIPGRQLMLRAELR